MTNHAHLAAERFTVLSEDLSVMKKLGDQKLIGAYGPQGHILALLEADRRRHMHWLGKPPQCVHHDVIAGTYPVPSADTHTDRTHTDCRDKNDTSSWPTAQM